MNNRARNEIIKRVKKYRAVARDIGSRFKADVFGRKNKRAVKTSYKKNTRYDAESMRRRRLGAATFGLVPDLPNKVMKASLRNMSRASSREIMREQQKRMAVSKRFKRLETKLNKRIKNSSKRYLDMLSKEQKRALDDIKRKLSLPSRSTVGDMMRPENRIAPRTQLTSEFRQLPIDVQIAELERVIDIIQKIASDGWIYTDSSGAAYMLVQFPVPTRPVYTGGDKTTYSVQLPENFVATLFSEERNPVAISPEGALRPGKGGIPELWKRIRKLFATSRRFTSVKLKGKYFRITTDKTFTEVRAEVIHELENDSQVIEVKRKYKEYVEACKDLYTAYAEAKEGKKDITDQEIKRLADARELARSKVITHPGYEKWWAAQIARVMPDSVTNEEGKQHPTGFKKIAQSLIAPLSTSSSEPRLEPATFRPLGFMRPPTAEAHLHIQGKSSSVLVPVTHKTREQVSKLIGMDLTPQNIDKIKNNVVNFKSGVTILGRVGGALEKFRLKGTPQNEEGIWVLPQNSDYKYALVSLPVYLSLFDSPISWRSHTKTGDEYYGLKSGVQIKHIGRGFEIQSLEGKPLSNSALARLSAKND